MTTEPRLVATLVTNQALDDFTIFLKTLALWNSEQPPTLFVFGDVEAKIILEKSGYTGKTHFKDCLSPYSALNRSAMEKMPGKFSPTLWMDFQMEKLNVLKWVFEEFSDQATTQGVFYFDADICFLTGLPDVPLTAKVGLCPHMIRSYDEDRFGKYNAGYVWIKSAEAVEVWREACKTSRFFEQSALEVFGTDPVWRKWLYEFPIQHNYGWWRMWQSSHTPYEVMKDWGMFRAPKTAGIVVKAKALASVHTHWNSHDFATREFNKVVFHYLKRLAGGHPPAAQMVRILSPYAAALPAPHV